MRFEGTVKSWNDERGFGFIEPLKGGTELFVHIKAFPSTLGRPSVGTQVTFDVETSAEGKKRAANIQLLRTALLNDTRSGVHRRPWDTTSLVVLGVFGLSYLLFTIIWSFFIYVGVVYLVMSLVCALFYWHDKGSAKLGEWRTPEETLLVLGGMCGWPGAMVAQHYFQHKTTKRSFRNGHWTSVVINLVLFYAFAGLLFVRLTGAHAR